MKPEKKRAYKTKKKQANPNESSKPKLIPRTHRMFTFNQLI
jgi:non-ribosomal peptide synthetase component E (peptide arylation enzyme)